MSEIMLTLIYLELLTLVKTGVRPFGAKSLWA